MTSQNYRRYMLIILATILAFNYVDRYALGIMLEDIKFDLDLSDTQLGFLTGIAFAAFYAIMGLPIARWADRADRIKIISVTTGLWSVAVALSGFAGNFIQLVLIRVGVAVGEAGCIPPAHSLIADYFTRLERSRALSAYMLGVPLSVVIGYFGAGWLNEFYGWRVTFVLLGAPGVLLALLAWFSLREPRLGDHRRRGDRAIDRATPEQQISADKTVQPFGSVAMILWSNDTFRNLVIFFSVVYFFGYGILQWQPAFFIRSHGLGTGELGTWFALIYGVGGFIGTYLGGELTHHYAAGNERLQLRASAVLYALFGGISFFIYFTENVYLAFFLMSVSAIGGALATGPMFAVMQTLVPERMRATSIAITYLFANLIGMGLGPIAAGVLSDTFRPWWGDESLRYALLILCPGYVWGALHMWQASRTVVQDLARAESSHEPCSISTTSQKEKESLIITARSN